MSSLPQRAGDRSGLCHAGQIFWKAAGYRLRAGTACAGRKQMVSMKEGQEMEDKKKKELIQSKLVSKLQDTIYFLERESELQDRPEDADRYQHHIHALEKLIEEVKQSGL